MLLDEYQERARTMAVYPGEFAYNYLALGVAGEAGEVANKVKKVLRDKNGVMDDTSRALIVDELGDVLWYIALMAHELGVTLQDVAEGNIAKLTERKARNLIHDVGRAE